MANRHFRMSHFIDLTIILLEQRWLFHAAIIINSNIIYSRVRLFKLQSLSKSEALCFNSHLAKTQTKYELDQKYKSIKDGRFVTCAQVLPRISWTTTFHSCAHFQVNVTLSLVVKKNCCIISKKLIESVNPTIKLPGCKNMKGWLGNFVFTRVKLFF